MGTPLPPHTVVRGPRALVHALLAVRPIGSYVVRTSADAASSDQPLWEAIVRCSLTLTDKDALRHLELASPTCEALQAALAAAELDRCECALPDPSTHSLEAKIAALKPPPSMPVVPCEGNLPHLASDLWRIIFMMVANTGTLRCLRLVCRVRVLSHQVLRFSGGGVSRTLSRRIPRQH